MTSNFSKNIQRLAHRLSLELVIGVWLLGIFGLPEFAYANGINCGDTITPGESVVLDSDLIDCMVSPALIIQGGPVTVDLNDYTISCALDESGGVMENSIGIQVTGSKAKISNGAIENCYIGVEVEGTGKHHLHGLVVEHTVPFVPKVDDDGFGFLVLSDKNRFTENTVMNISGEGFGLGDDDDEDIPANRNILKHNTVSGTGNHAYRIKNGEHNLLLYNLAENSVAEGFRSQDKHNKFIRNTATGCGDEGFRLKDPTAEKNLLIGNFAQGNGFPPFSLCNPFPLPPAEADVNPGIAATEGAKNNWIFNNTSIGNCIGIGVETGSKGNKIINNTALDNPLIDLVDQIPDCDSTKWINNTFDSSALVDISQGVILPDPECIR